MTAKRFMLDDCGELIDLNNHKFIDYGEDCCNLLNEQHETIERLKDNCKVLDEVKCEIAEENEQLKKELDKLKVVNEMLSMDFSNSEHELLKENEQLKQKIKGLQKESYGNLDGINYYQEQNGHLSSKISDLKCENEQLKQENQSWLKTASHLDTVAHEDRDYAKRMHKENEHIKQTIKTMMENERTELGKSVLKQLNEAIS